MDEKLGLLLKSLISYYMMDGTHYTYMYIYIYIYIYSLADDTGVEHCIYGMLLWTLENSGKELVVRTSCIRTCVYH